MDEPREDEELNGAQAGPASDAAGEPTRPKDAGAEGAEGRTDLKGILRQLTQPMVESLDTRLRDQVETHVDEMLGPKVEAALSDRLRTVDRAIASLSATVEELEGRLARLERSGQPVEGDL